MHYRNSEVKLDQLIGYFNEGKINLIPPFQRGHVWTLPMRKRLIRNIVSGRPIPAIFLYKEAVGSKYSYNILDGKQRLESLLLFIGGKRTDVRILSVNQYFFTDREKESANFTVDLDTGPASFKDLSEEDVRDFREYAIPTIEISLEDSSLDEIIDLFIDINQQGSKVNRFDIVKAIGRNNPLLLDVFDLLANKQKRREDVFYKKKNTEFTRVLERLQIMQNLPNPNSKVDRMWERLLEIVLFSRTGKHRAPAQILKSFIHNPGANGDPNIAPAEMKKLSRCFKFLSGCYSRSAEFAQSRFAMDQTHFYTMVTSMLASDMLAAKDGVPPDRQELERKLLAFARIIDGKTNPPKNLAVAVKDYQTKSQKQTTHIGQREGRQSRFLEIMAAL